MAFQQLIILLCVSLCACDSDDPEFEKLFSIIREEAKLLNISAVKLVLSCTATYVGVVSEQHRKNFMSEIMYTSLDLVRSKRDIAKPKNLRKSYERGIRLLNETAEKLSDESNNFWKMAVEEFLTTMDGFYKSMEFYDGKNITDAQLRAIETIPHSHNKVIRVYNNLSTNSKSELEKTFCLRTIFNLFRHNLLLSNKGNEMLTQEYWDKIGNSNYTLNLPKLEVVGGYV